MTHLVAWARLIVAALIFAQTIRVAWRAIAAHLAADRVVTAYAALPWDPSAVLRVGPLTPAETAAARRSESVLTDSLSW